MGIQTSLFMAFIGRDVLRGHDWYHFFFVWRPRRDLTAHGMMVAGRHFEVAVRLPQFKAHTCKVPPTRIADQ
jgi:hypothetical protein